MAIESDDPTLYPSQEERRFANGVAIESHNGMVFLDFVQEEPMATGASTYTGVVRLAIPPDIAIQMGQRLSSLRQVNSGETGATPNV